MEAFFLKLFGMSILKSFAYHGMTGLKETQS